MRDDPVIRAAIASLEAVLEKHAHLAPEFAMQAALEWSQNYRPGRTTVMYAQESQVERLKDGLIPNITLNQVRVFPFLLPVEVTLP